MNPAIERATNALKFVAQHVKNEDNFNSYADDWKYVAMVLDRILLWMFTIACVVGNYNIFFILEQAERGRRPSEAVNFSDRQKPLFSLMAETDSERKVKHQNQNQNP